MGGNYMSENIPEQEIGRQPDSNLEKPFNVGTCDICETENVYVKEGYDAWGTHVADSCFYGCNDLRNVPNEPEEEISILKIKKLSTTNCYDSTWEIVISVSGEPETHRLMRYNTESEENLRSKISACRNREAITRLNQYVFHD
jgi:hypothetical protein